MSKIYKSCIHIESSLYVAPNEIRACCQRFFYKDKMRGDTRLLEIQENKSPSTNDIINARNKLSSLVIENPAEIKNNKNRIFISAAQAYDDVFSNLISMNIDKKRIISGIFL